MVCGEKYDIIPVGFLLGRWLSATNQRNADRIEYVKFKLLQ